MTVQLGGGATRLVLPSRVVGRGPVPLRLPTVVGGSGPFSGGPNLPARSPVSQTLAQVANQRVNQQLAPQVQAQNAFNNRQDQVIQSFANALLGKLQPQAGEVGQAYDSAIQQQGALSGAAAQYLNAQNPSGAVQQLLQSAGAPQSQQDQIANQLGQTFGGGAGVLQFVGGAIPGGQLASDKAAAVGEAAQLPGIAALKGQQDLASALWQQGQDRRTLEATRPALYQQAAQDIRTNQNARAKNVLTAAQNRQTNLYKAASLGEKQREFGATQQGKAADRALKQKAADFLDWYRTEGVNQTQAKIDQKATEFGVSAAQRDKQIAISASRAKTSAAQGAERLAQGAERIKIAQRKAASSGTKLSTAASGRYGVQIDTSGNPILRNGKTVPYPKTTAGADSTGGARLQKLIATIDAGLSVALNGGSYDKSGKVSPGGGYGKDGTPLPPVDRAGAMAELEKHGYFATPSLKKLAIARLNKIYPSFGPSTTVRGKGPLGVSAAGLP